MKTKKTAHRLTYLSLLLTLFCLVGNSIAGHGDTAQNTTVKIQLIQGTKDGGAVSSLPVELYVYEHEDMIQHLESISDVHGIALFEGVMLGEHRTAQANTDYKGMHFSSKSIGFIPGHTKATSAIMVYEVSYDNSPISLDTSHIIIELSEDGLKVTEYVELLNPTDKAISAKKSEQDNFAKVLYFEPFKGFKNLEFGSYFVASAVLTTEDGFYDTMAIPPGSHQAIYSYTLDLNAETIDMTKKMTFSIGDLTVFSKLGPGKISGMSTPPSSMIDEYGIECEYFSLSDIKSGDVIKLKATGLNFRKSTKNQTIIMCTVFALMAILIGFRMIKGNTKDCA